MCASVSNDQAAGCNVYLSENATHNTNKRLNHLRRGGLGVCTPFLIFNHPSATSRSEENNNANSSSNSRVRGENADGGSVSGSADRVTTPRPFACDVAGCTRAFTTKSGLGVHKSSAHPVLANDAIVTQRIKGRWSLEEKRLLATTEAGFIHADPTNTDRMDSRLKLALNSERSCEAIKCQRRKPEHKQLVEQALVDLRRERSESPESIEEEVTIRDQCLQLLGQLASLTSASARSMSSILSDFIEYGVIDDDRLINWVRRATRARPFTPGSVSNTERHRVDTQTTARARRRGRYARFQNLWRRDRKRLADEVLNPKPQQTDPVPSAEVFDTWSGIFGESSIEVDLSDFSTKSTSLSRIWKPVSVEEVTSNELEVDSAAGLDGVSSSKWRRINPAVRAAFFNVVMGRGGFPMEMEKGRTIFIAKKEGSRCPKDLRPITVTSVPVRQINKIFAKRAVCDHNWDPRQRAFIPADGCAENHVVLQSIIGDAKQKLRELHVGSVDISKAYDSISHNAVIGITRKYGAPEAFVQYLSRSYENMRTVLQFCGQERQVDVRRGVRQGDPLSPILFNLAIEMCLQKLDPDIGYQIDDQNRCNAVCYADDSNLIASTRQGLQRNLQIFASALLKLGLELNRDKCVVLSIKPDGRNKRFKIETDPQVSLNGVSFRQIGVDGLWKYLGVEFEGTQALGGKTGLKDKLTLITKAPLKPQQKLELLRTFLLPKYLHSMVLGRLEMSMYKQLDIVVRAVVRRWLHLPKDVTNGVFHTSIKEGGLGIPAFATTIPALKYSRYTRLNNSDSPIVRATINLQVYTQMLGKLESCIRKLVPDGDAGKLCKYWVNHLQTSADGKDLHDASKAAANTNFVARESHIISGGDFVGLIHTRFNCLPSRMRTTRGRNLDRTCRAGCEQNETTYHIVQSCFRTHGGRVLRHDKVVNTMAAELSSTGFTVHKEPMLNTSVGLRKPDLVVVKDNQAFVIDAHVTGCSNIRLAHQQKLEKYRNIGGMDGVVRAVCGGSAVNYIPATISYKGIWYPSSYDSLRGIGLSCALLSRITRYVLFGSLLNFRRFNSCTSRYMGRVDRRGQ